RSLTNVSLPSKWTAMSVLMSTADTRLRCKLSADRAVGRSPLSSPPKASHFPPEDYYGRPSFRRVLVSISDAYREKNADVMEQSKLVESAISHSESFAGKNGDFSPAIIQEIIAAGMKMFDETHGGFGSTPKFPHPSILDLMIDQFARSGDDKLRHVFTTTLEKMA